MLRKSLRAIDRVGEEIFDHPIRNAKILAGTAMACLALEKIHEGFIAWRYPEEPATQPTASSEPQPELVEASNE